MPHPSIQSAILVSFLAVGATLLATAPLESQAQGRGGLPSAGASHPCDDVAQRRVVNSRQLNPRTRDFLLFDAAEAGCLALVEQLLPDGADRDRRDRSGRTAVDLAASEAVR